MPDRLVIVGAGHAAGQLIVSLRQGGFDGAITLVGEEAYPPYQRPPLSKKYLAGEIERERLYLRPQRFYAEHEVELRLGRRAVTLDRGAQSLELDDGGTLGYDRLVLATGSDIRRLDIPGHGLAGINYVRGIDDVDAIRQDFVPGARIVVIGAGYIGLEVAAVACKAGLAVTVIEVGERVMGRVASPEISEFYAAEHRAAGVELRLGVSPGGSFTGDGHVDGFVTGDGDRLDAELVVAGIGIRPRTGLAARAGLACDDGIVVDEHCRTSDPAILAIGDCTRHPNALLGRSLRLESVHNAQEQAKTAAGTLVGELRPYAQVPWFWSDQYDLKLQIAGLAEPGHRRLVRGEPGARAFAVLHFEGRRLLACEAVNSAREFMWSKKLIATGRDLDPEALADAARDFKSLAESALGAELSPG